MTCSSGIISEMTPQICYHSNYWTIKTGVFSTLADLGGRTAPRTAAMDTFRWGLGGGGDVVRRMGTQLQQQQQPWQIALIMLDRNTSDWLGKPRILTMFLVSPYKLDIKRHWHGILYFSWTKCLYLSVTVRALHGFYIGGLFIQARRARNCNTDEQKMPVGVFKLLPGERHLKLMSCNNRLNVRHIFILHCIIQSTSDISKIEN